MVSVEWAEMMVERYAIPEPNTGCWLWTRAVTDGYAVATIGGRSYRIARVLLGLPRGEGRGVKADTILALHRCDTPACVSRDHLFPGTVADNHADMLAKGRKREQAAWAAGKCLQGHDITDPKNVLVAGRKRRCRLCNNAAARARWIRKEG